MELFIGLNNRELLLVLKALPFFNVFIWMRLYCIEYAAMIVFNENIVCLNVAPVIISVCHTLPSFDFKHSTNAMLLQVIRDYMYVFVLQHYLAAFSQIEVYMIKFVVS